MRAAADVIHACACCGAVGIPENDQVLQVTVAEYRVFGQIYTQVLICMRYFCIHKLGSENSGKMVKKKKNPSYSLHRVHPWGAPSLSGLHHLWVQSSS